jgi:Undecaprenyl-phosphate glucose phosphotransferase
MEQHLFRTSGAPADGLPAATGLRQSVRPRARHQEHSAVDGQAIERGRHLSFLVVARDVHSPLQFVADSLAIVAIGVGTGVGYELVYRGSYGPIVDLACIGATLALMFAGISRLLAGQRLAALTNTFDRVRDTAQSWTLAFAGLAFVLFALKAGAEVSRGSVLTFYVIGLPLIAAWRVVTPVVLAPLGRKAGVSSRECIVIGDSADTQLDAFAAQLCASGHPAPTVLRFRAACLPPMWQQEMQSLTSRVMQVAHGLGPGEIFVCAGAIPNDRLSAIWRALSILPRAIFVVPDTLTASLVRCKPVSFGTHVAVEIRREPMDRTQRAVKRMMDVCVASIALAAASPFLLLVAAIVKLDSPGPVLFRQTRNGYRGMPFRMFKFRSMFVEEEGSAAARQAVRGDARVTRVGRFLRKSSIDELPQLLNVIRGDMSLVGPRPHPVALDEIYARSIGNYEVRQHVKPGLTGWAQVNGLRGETATVDKMFRRIEFDLWYAANASLLLDLEILVRTLVEVLRHRNAY